MDRVVSRWPVELEIQLGQQAAPTHPILSEPLVSVKTPCLRKHTLVVGSMGQAHSLLD